MKSKKTVLTIGGATQDIYVRFHGADSMKISKSSGELSYMLFESGAKIEVEDLSYFSGGGATNSAVTFSRQDCETTCFCIVSDDEAGAHVLKDLKDNHKIVIPVDRVAHVSVLNSMILERDETIKIGCMHGSTVPKIRKEVVAQAKTGEIDVLIATAKLIKEGLDIPPFSCIYSLMPQGNEENIYQQVSRIRTNYPNKNQPMIRHFVDNVGVSEACFKIAMRVYSQLDFQMKEAK